MFQHNKKHMLHEIMHQVYHQNYHQNFDMIKQNQLLSFYQFYQEIQEGKDMKLHNMKTLYQFIPIYLHKSFHQAVEVD